MKNIKETKKEILDALSDGEKWLMGFKIEIVGNSGNCSINKTEEELIKSKIAEVLQERGIDDFQILMEC